MPVGAASQAGPRKRGNFKLDTDDMDRWLVELRLTLEREKRRCQQAQMFDRFEKLLSDSLADRQLAAVAGESELRLTSVDRESMARLRNFLGYLIGQSIRVDQQELLQDALRQSLQDARRKRIKTQMELPQTGNLPPIEPFCLFCASSLIGSQDFGGHRHSAGPPGQPPVGAPRHSCPGAHHGEPANNNLPRDTSPEPPQPICAPLQPAEEGAREDARRCALTEELVRGQGKGADGETSPRMFMPEIRLIVPNSNQEVTPPPSENTTPEVGEQAAGSPRPYTPGAVQQAKQPQPAGPPTGGSQQVGSTTGQGSSQPQRPGARVTSQQEQPTTNRTNASNQQQQVIPPAATAGQQQQQQQQPAGGCPAQVSQLTNASGFVMPSDDGDSSDSDANSIRYVLDTINKSQARMSLDDRRSSTPTSDGTQDASAAKLVIDETLRSAGQSPIRPLNETSQYDFDEETGDEEEEAGEGRAARAPKPGPSRSHKKLAKSFKHSTGGLTKYTPNMVPIKNTHFVTMSSPSSSSSTASLGQHQASFRAQALASKAAVKMSASSNAGGAAATSGHILLEAASERLSRGPDASRAAPRTKRRPTRSNARG